MLKCSEDMNHHCKGLLGPTVSNGERVADTLAVDDRFHVASVLRGPESTENAGGYFHMSSRDEK